MDRLIASVNFGDDDSLAYFQRSIKKRGIIEDLEQRGIKEGDTVKCGDILGTSGTVPSEVNDQPHIHIEIYQNGELISPYDLLTANR